MADSKRGIKLVFSCVFLVTLIILFLLIIVSVPNANAGPYGYGDSMNLKYKIDNGKVIYGYGDTTKYATSLRPKSVNSSEWKPELKREVINLSWDEIFNPKQLNLIDNIFKIQDNQIIKIEKPISTPIVNEEHQNQTTLFENIINLFNELLNELKGGE